MAEEGTWEVEKEDDTGSGGSRHSTREEPHLAADTQVRAWGNLFHSISRLFLLLRGKVP